MFQDISFTLEENCHCALIGSNGTGKTTLTNLIREPDNYTFDGKLMLDGVGRIGYVSQFASRDGDQSVTVYDYLCQDFLALEQAIAEVCQQMESPDELDAAMECYQDLLDESNAVFDSYYHSHPNIKIVRAYLVYYAYGYLARDLKVKENIFHYIKL